MMCQRIGYSPISTMGLGLTSVCSARRLPMPPARIATFTDIVPSHSWVAALAVLALPAKDWSHDAGHMTCVVAARGVAIEAIDNLKSNRLAFKEVHHHRIQGADGSANHQRAFGEKVARY